MDDLFLKARSVDLFHYMTSLGYVPVRYNDRKASFLSPKRDEKHPSFEIDRRMNRWSDYGDAGAFGSPIDFIMWMKGCDELEAAKTLVNDIRISTHKAPSKEKRQEKSIEVLNEWDEITNEALVDYCENERKIPIYIVNRFCKQVLFQFSSSKYVKYFGVGWPNDNGGHSIRGLWFRGSTRPAGISTITKGNTNETMVFEGMMDFLSYMVLYGGLGHEIIVLNSLIFIPMITDYLKEKTHVHLWIDNDAAADEKAEYLKESGVNIVDHRGEFMGYNDLNELLQKEYEV